MNVKALCDRRSLDPVTAFLTVDWMAREPREAKKALSSGYDALFFGDKDAEQDLEGMNSKECEPEDRGQDFAEDESDLVCLDIRNSESL